MGRTQNHPHDVRDVFPNPQASGGRQPPETVHQHLNLNVSPNRERAGKVTTSSINGFDRVWFLTWTTYGTWLPGDDRGFVSPTFASPKPGARRNQLGTAFDRGGDDLQTQARTNLKGKPIWLSPEQATVIRHQIDETAMYRGWTILAGAIMSNHVHLVIGVSGDPDPMAMMRDFKSYASRRLNQTFARPDSGTWWTEQGSKRRVRDRSHVDAVMDYVKHQLRPLIVWNNEVACRSGCDIASGG